MSSPRPDTPLYAVLCAILAARIDPARALPPLPEDGETWRALLALAHAERVSPLVYLSLKDQPGCPADILANLRGVYYNTARYNTQLFHALDATLARLSAAGVDVILLKGAALAESLYANPALRPVTDVDLLVRPGQVLAALNALRAGGWTVGPGEPLQDVARDYRHELALTHPGFPTTLELHWALLQPRHYKRRAHLDALWSSARSLPIRAGGALELGPEASLIYLSAHWMLQHSGKGLLWLYDIALTTAVYAGAIDWERLLAWAQDWRLVLSARAALRGAARQLGAPIPADVLARLERMRPSLPERYVYARFVDGMLPPAGVMLAQALEMHGGRRRLGYILREVFPPRAYMIERYHIRRAWLAPLYYPYRLLVGLFSRYSAH